MASTGCWSSRSSCRREVWMREKFRWPRLDDLAAGSVTYPNAVLRTLQGNLENNLSALLAGPEGRGKSTIAAVLGFLRTNLSQPVWVADFSGHRDTADQVAAAIRNRDLPGTLWILEDCHEAEQPDLEILVEATRRARHSEFLYCLRAVTEKQAIAWWGAVAPKQQAKGVVFCSPDTRLIRSIARSLQVDTNGNVQPNELTEADALWLRNQCGGNLRIIGALLASWQPSTQSIRDLTFSSLYEHILEQRLRPLLSEAPLLKAYIDSCAMFQFNISIWSGSMAPSSLARLKSLGYIGEPVNGTIVLPHASDARLSLEAFAHSRRERPQALTSRLLLTYFENGPPLWYSLRFLTGVSYGIESGRLLKTPDFMNRLWSLVQDRRHPKIAQAYIEAVSPSRDDLRRQFDSDRSRLKEILLADDMTSARALVASAKRVDNQLARSLWALLDRDDKVRLNSRCRLGSFAKTLWHYTHDRRSRAFARAILVHAFKQDEAAFHDKIRLGAVSSAGRLAKVVYDVDEQLAPRVIEAIAEHVTLQSDATSEDISLLLSHVKRNERAYGRLLTRVILECDPAELLALEPRERFSYLLGYLATGWETLTDELRARALVFFQTFSAETDAQMIKSMPSRNLALTIWNFLRVGVSPKPWIEGTLDAIEERSRKMQVEEVFFLLWNLVQVGDEAVAVIAGSALRLLEEGSSASAPMLPLLALAGLLTHLGYPVKVHELGSSERQELATELKTVETAALLVFALLGLRRCDPLAFTYMREDLRHEDGGMEGRAGNLISRNPVAQSRARLDEVLAYIVSV